MKLERRRQFVYLILVLPWIISLALFWVSPLAQAVILSFSEYSTLSGASRFVGLDNFRRLAGDPLVQKALITTTIFTVGTVPVTTALALLLAVLLHSGRTRFVAFFRASFFLPSATSLVVLSLVFTHLYSRDGYLGSLLGMLGLPPSEYGYLLDPGTALPAIMAMDVLISVGYYMVLIMAGMQTISTEIYESATLMGATSWQTLMRITIPLLRPTLVFVLLINTIKSFQIFVEIYVMTKGGPLHATTTLVYLVYEYAFTRADSMGYASALAIVVFLILALFTIVQNRFLRVR